MGSMPVCVLHGVLAWYAIEADFTSVQEVGPVSAVAVALVTETSCIAPMKAPFGH